MTNPRKAFPIDMGLIPVFDPTGRPNIGHALETAVLLELERRGAQTSYVRTAGGFEVDFLARYPSGGRDLFQVCANLDAPATREREIRALLEAGKEHSDATLNLVSLTPETPPDLPNSVVWHSASMWLLGEHKEPPKPRRSRAQPASRKK